ncbi:MAG: hypothetical protein BWY11_01115 [Firmicutes bacterium ADurb.Bin182]|nr:MAG: hypothetical protein BWY11_01115 [Firmicutes bacterium ADurb.Bin182]
MILPEFNEIQKADRSFFCFYPLIIENVLLYFSVSRDKSLGTHRVTGLKVIIIQFNAMLETSHNAYLYLVIVILLLYLQYVYLSKNTIAQQAAQNKADVINRIIKCSGISYPAELSTRRAHP